MSDTIFFDGHDLGSIFIVDGAVTRTLTPWEPTLIDVGGRDGQLVGGTHATALEVRVRLHAMDGTRDQRQEALRTLAAWLAVDGPRPLTLGYEGMRYRMALPTGAPPVSPYLNGDTVEVTFVCPDPVLHGAERSVTVPGTGSKSLTWFVGGTAQTWPTISVTVAVDEADLYWKLALDDGSYVAYYPTYNGAVSTDAVTIDCADRVMRRGSAPIALPLEADWLALAPGEHTLTISGTAASSDATVTYRERWW